MELDSSILVKKTLFVIFEKVFLRPETLFHFQEQIEDYFYGQFCFLIYIVVNQHF